MTMTELMPLLRQLNRAEKLHVMQCLVSDLAQGESDLLRQDMSYPIWSPYDAFEAADTMFSAISYRLIDSILADKPCCKRRYTCDSATRRSL